MYYDKQYYFESYKEWKNFNSFGNKKLIDNILSFKTISLYTKDNVTF